MSKSHDLFLRAQRVIPGGVNSPVRSFNGVGGGPVFFKRGEGAYIFDADDKCYIDYVGSWGPLILGHAHPTVIQAVQEIMRNGLSFGAPTEIEVLMAEEICRLMPNIEMIRMVNSGTEATMSAIRVARGFTGRNKILKFEGCYHGHSDALLVKAGSGSLTLNTPSSAGVPVDFIQNTLTATFNDLEQVRSIFAEHGEEIAAVIVEPIAGNMNMILPVPGFLLGLRHVCDQYGSLLIFDEVMTGFRVALGGAQSYYDIKPDLTTLSKIIGGGMPVGAFGGRRDIMEQLAPLGPIYQAGTLSGNPVAMAAGLATLKALAKPGFYEALSATTSQLVTGLVKQARAASIPFTAHSVGGMFGIFFTEASTVSSYEQALACHVSRFKQFFHGMLELGIYLAPSAFEAGFVSAAHQSTEVESTIEAAARVFEQIRQKVSHGT